MLSSVTMGAAASKKLNPVLPVSRTISSARAPLVKGPVATITGPSGMASACFSTRRMRGFSRMAAVTASEKASRSTANAPPAATAVFSAQGTIKDPSRRISSLSIPEAESSRAAFKELEQTSSASPGYLWAGE